MSPPFQRTITVLLADRQSLFCAGLQTSLTSAKDIQIVGEAQDGFETQKLVAELRPQILLFEINMPGPHPLELQEWVRKHAPETITLVLTAQDRDNDLAMMMEAGVAGYLYKHESAEELENAIRRAAQGEILFDQAQLARARQWQEEVGSKLKQLTHRERDLLQLVVMGKTDKQISLELGLVERTVRYHLQKIYEKLGVSTRVEAAVQAVKWGLIQK
ncbi:MAG: response regulator transcription factor [Chloroflexi bacterium]|nr:response regulator transcription factor [Chloroflexota bacterium]MBI3339231.1 response regulator transcription factor [Chloroflexota bacterium]